MTMDELEALYLAQEQELLRNYQRSLPFQDTMFDRWQRAQRLNFGEGTSVYNSACIFGDVKVGKQTWIGPYTILDGLGGELRIGDHCAISSGVHIYTHDTVLRTLSGGRCAMHKAKVSIGDRCHLAPKVVISAGVSLGQQCLVAMNSYVNKSYGDNLILAGTPAKPIGRVEFDAAGLPMLTYD